MLRWGVLVPEYEIIELPLKSPLKDATSSPACVIQALDSFEPFGGDYINADSKQVQIMGEDAERKKSIRQKKLNILFSRPFAAFLAVTKFIANNDSHQENFGLSLFNGKSTLSAIDFDMAPMPFLIEEEFFGPFNAEQFNRKNNYHCEDGGRHSPFDIDLETFPTPNERSKTPDGDVTLWCIRF